MSSALAAPALAGVPVTHRGVAHDVTVVSGHLPPGHPDSLVDWAALARARGTVVLLMAVDTIAKIASVLIEHGRAPETPVLAVQDAGLPDQRSVPARLDEIGAVAAREGVGPPPSSSSARWSPSPPPGRRADDYSLRAVSGPVMRSSSGRVEAMTPRQAGQPDDDDHVEARARRDAACSPSAP